MAEFTYNNSKHSITALSPFFVYYSFHPQIRFKAGDGLPEGRVPAAIERIKVIYEVRKTLAERWQKASE